MPSKQVKPDSNIQLNIQEQVFLERYLTCWSPARAAREAGYMVDNPQYAKQAGYEILRKPHIRKAIDDRLRTMCMEANECLARLAAIARGDITDLLSQDPTTLEWHPDISKIRAEGNGYLVKSFSQNRFGESHIELHSASDALDKIARHLKLYKEDTSVVNVSITAWANFVRNGTFTTPNLPPPSGPDDGSVVDASFAPEGEEPASSDEEA